MLRGVLLEAVCRIRDLEYIVYESPVTLDLCDVIPIQVTERESFGLLDTYCFLVCTEIDHSTAYLHSLFWLTIMPSIVFDCIVTS